MQELFCAFNAASKYTHTSLFLRSLFRLNPWLKFSAMRYSKRISLIDRLEKAAFGRQLFKKGKCINVCNECPALCKVTAGNFTLCSILEQSGFQICVQTA